MENTTINDFVLSLWNRCGYKTIDENLLPHLLLYGHKRGWLEDSDETNPHKPLDRRTAARIVHQFIKIEMHIPDETDISQAENLKDLWTKEITQISDSIRIKPILPCENVTVKITPVS